MAAKLNLQTNKTINRLFFKLLPVQVAIFAMASINSLVDGIMAGRYVDASTVGVIGLYITMTQILNAIGAVLLGGTAVVCGRYMGSGDMDKTRHVFSVNLTVTFLTAAFITAISLLMPGSMAGWLGATDALRGPLELYIIGYAFGIIPQLLAQQIAAFLQLERQGTRSMVAIISMIASNVVLDIVLVGVLRMGIWGLALATSISNWIYFIIVVQYYFTGKAQLRFSLRSLAWREIIPIVTIGFPGALLILCLGFRTLALNRILLTYSGQDGLSAMGSFNMVCNLILAVCLGTGAVIRMMAAIFIGEEDRDSIKQLLKIAFTKGLLLAVIVGAVVIGLSSALSALFFPDTSSEVFTLTKQLFIIYGCCVPLVQICQINTNYLQAAGHNLYINVLSVFDGLPAMLIPAMILAPSMGALGVWLSNPIGIILTMLLSPLYSIVRNKRIPKTVDEWLLFADDFGVSEDNRLSLQISDIGDVSMTSIGVQEFCESHGEPARNAYMAALCLEEMAANVVEHGFSADNKSHTVDVRMIYRTDGVLIRIKDDCIPFDPLERAKAAGFDEDNKNPDASGDDLLDNIGIKMVYKLADEVSYNNLLGLNVLTLSFKS